MVNASEQREHCADDEFPGFIDVVTLGPRADERDQVSAEPFVVQLLARAV